MDIGCYLERTEMTKVADAYGVTSELAFSDGIAASRTMLALRANGDALQQRLPSGWTLAPYEGDDIRGLSLRRANVLIPFHEVFAFSTNDGAPTGLPQASYVVFISQARYDATGELGHVHWHTYTEDPDAVPGKYRDAVLADITRSQTFSKQHRGETHVHETFSAVSESGEIHLSLDYDQGGDYVLWAAPDEPNLALYAARDTSVVRWYKEDQVLNIVRSEPLNIDRVSDISLMVRGDLSDVFDGTERTIGVVIQRPYMRRVHVRNH
jgi:hypothetical protein